LGHWGNGIEQLIVGKFWQENIGKLPRLEMGAASQFAIIGA
jgi:hypothetical protein